MSRDYTGQHRGDGGRRPAVLSAFRRPLLGAGMGLLLACSTVAATPAVAATQAGSTQTLDLNRSAAEMLTAGLPSSAQQIETAVEAGHLAGGRALAAIDAATLARLDKAAADAAAKKAAARKAAAAKALAARRAAAARSARSRTRQALPAGGGSPRTIAKGMLGQFGWSSSQFGCLNSLWMKESGWNVHANNPSSSAYGIPQSLPGSKMASAGPNWQSSASTQIRWGLGYIKSRYGSPCAAWGHSQSVNWY